MDSNPGQRFKMAMPASDIKDRIIDASAVLSLAKSLYRQLRSIENSKYEQTFQNFGGLLLIQTSIYCTVVINLYHLVKESEKHSIAKLAKASVDELGLSESSREEIMALISSCSDKIEQLKLNRDKRIAHFDLKNTPSLSDQTIEDLLGMTEKCLLILNLKVLNRHHSFDMVMKSDVSTILDALTDWWASKFNSID